MELKCLEQLQKKTGVVYSWLRSHSLRHLPIDSCGLFIRHEEYKSQATRIQAMQPFTTAIEASVKLLFLFSKTSLWL